MVKEETVKLNINISKELLDKVDLFAKKMYVNRTSAVAFLLANSLEEFDFQNKNKKEDLVL